MSLLVLIAASTAVPDLNEIWQPTSIPIEMRGVWDMTSPKCNEEFSDTRMTLGINWLSMHELYGLVAISHVYSDIKGHIVFRGRFNIQTEGILLSGVDHEYVWSDERPDILVERDANDATSDAMGAAETVWTKCVLG